MPGSDAGRRMPPHTTMRTLRIPDTGPRPLRFKPIPPQVEVTVSPPARVPFRAVLPADDATPERIAALVDGAAELRRLAVGEGRGAIDVTLQSKTGTAVKTGSLLLTRKGHAPIRVPIDPITRRFRAGDVPSGRWQVRAVASGYGGGRRTVVVRAFDTVRCALRLDGHDAPATSPLRFRINGAAGRVQIVARDRTSGKVVFERKAPVNNGTVALAAVPHGALHFEFVGNDAGSCYDLDVNEITAAAVHDISIVPGWQLPVPEPDPPPWLLLGEALDGVARVLPSLGVESVEQLAGMRAEALMHRMLDRGAPPIHPRLFDAAIEGAQQQLGIVPTSGAARLRLRLDAKQQVTRQFRLTGPGTIELDVDLGVGAKGRLALEGLGQKREFPITGQRTIRLGVSEKQWRQNALLRMRLINQTARRVDGVLLAQLPAEPGATATAVTDATRDRIEKILVALAPHNPGLAITVPDDVLTDQNIAGWLDRARTVMRQLGICSINDLGTLRIEPNQVLECGAYVAPARPPSADSVVALEHYKFESILGGTVVHYKPNDILDEWAVIAGKEWDIRDRAIVISRHVRELMVIARRVVHNNGTVIMWERPDLPTGPAYAPSPAPPGAYHQAYGAHGSPGGDGDQNPHVSKNGGVSSNRPAPTVTMYILDATSNLPPILLMGQQGGQGGRGQDGGRGGDGFMGAPAEGTWYGGCCRGPGYGGSGGPGGRGGKGGRGGRGGRGGQITVLTTAAGLEVMGADPPLILCSRGPGGLPGVPGAAGPGGTGGPAGTADCISRCSETPERRGSDGPLGDLGEFGESGSPGPPVLSDAIQFLEITAAQWERAFNSPHILHIFPTSAHVGDRVTLIGENFDPGIDVVFFDGEPAGTVLSATRARFDVPVATGTYHAVVIKPLTGSKRISNTVFLLVQLTLNPLPPLTRWEEGETVEVTGTGFMPGCQLLAEDWSADPVTTFSLAIDFQSPTMLRTTIPDAPLGNLRGVRRLRVRNPSGATTMNEVVVRIGKQIIVKCAAFRLVGQDSGVTTSQTPQQITALFVEGGFNALTHWWGAADIVFQLVQPVKDVLIDDEIAECFPEDPEGEELVAAMTAVAAAAPFVPGAINLVFCNDVEGDVVGFTRTGGGGPSFLGEAGDELEPAVRLKLAAHELGHSLCLTHACGEEGLPDCTELHMTRMMYPEVVDEGPFGEQSSTAELTSSEIQLARRTATHFERGKTTPAVVDNIQFGSTRCLEGDADN